MLPANEHAAVQAIAKNVLAELARSILPIDTERTIAARAEKLLADRGLTETWYYDCPALVLLGSRSCHSFSGRSYLPSAEPVGEFNVVTVDLSPVHNGAWGDCARTFLIEDGTCTTTPQTPEFRLGMEVEAALHQSVREFATPDMTFEELHAFGNAEIKRHGFVNLDFLGNLGHSIVSKREDRRYIENGNTLQLSSVRFFTFEPHVRLADGKWGFKHEEIYYFDSKGTLCAL